METLAQELNHQTYLSVSVMALRLCVALFCGAVIGFEREWHDHAAGFRTHILICLAAAVVAIAAIEMTHLNTFETDQTRIDPLRLIEALTSGVAFLAAGTIVFARGEVRGLTTGAGMWLAGVTGLASGLGFWQLAFLATLMAMAVLWLLRMVERAMRLRDGKQAGRREDEKP
ncbi:MgtC/SapB family protein [Rhizobium sp. SSA_523]|uniref:MgtC/SapB family protein n=1 Tax=Rhizobium sp. SSA_523 TaxID=2952477 RepID=UPI002090CA28|nr:MgtC/SapB family protein [Rhizobium sp. SSA_523]MCO5732380.1 MgtC/SapB family protein [Rhizobium sp. SSA_523]WKC21225.1 MgtC/SapB family protein [Rhizobium sp. SSA_523]